MRLLWAGIVLASLAAAQDTGVLQGTLIERDQSAVGELAVRLPDNRVLRLRYDTRTYLEREGRRISPAELAMGDRVEVLSEKRFARSVHVLSEPALPTAKRLRPRPSYSVRPLDDLFPRGDLTFSGTIARLSPGVLVLRTREQGQTRLLLREDTRYMGEGEPADAGDLRVNTRVFVRAGKNLDGDLEAFQVVWGRIFNPRTDEQ